MHRVLHYHPLSSYCQKVLIALYALDLAFEPKRLNLGDPAERDAFAQLWPPGKMPVLVEDGRVIAESSIVIEHLDAEHQLLPREREAALQTRLWDRISDLYVMTPLQAVVANVLQPEAQRDPRTEAKAQQTLQMAYGMLDQRLREQPWLSGERFGLADCAAAPALFYADAVLRHHGDALRAYVTERLFTHPAVARTLNEARPWLRYFPLRERLAEPWRQWALEPD